jgi:hypothetical protein
LWPHAG